MSGPSIVPTKTAPRPAPPPVVVRDGVGQLFAFFDNQGQMQTVDRRASVPPAARGEVLVTIPGQHFEQDQVVVADLRRADGAGRYRSWLSTRARWLDRTMPKTSELKVDVRLVARRKPAKRHTKPPRKRPPRSAQRTATKVGAAASATPPPRAAAPSRSRVVIFTTQWCPSCRRAKAYFQSKGVPFIELDVERDPRAAQAYQAVARQHGLRGGAVPVIVIGDRVFQGFSPFQVEVALNQMKAGG